MNWIDLIVVFVVFGLGIWIGMTGDKWGGK